MSQELFENFLDDPTEYQRASDYWIDVWDHIDPVARASNGWRDSWVSTGATDILDGNPIFSAVSDTMKRGIRIIQVARRHGKAMDFAYWLDTFGGSINDAQAIVELVIVCALSRETASMAQDLMKDWVVGPIRRTRLEVTAYGVPRRGVSCGSVTSHETL